MKRVTTLLVAVLFGLPLIAQAQPSPNNSREWWAKVEKQAYVNLGSPDVEIRIQSLKNAIYLATLYPEQFSLDRSVDRLLHIAQKDPANLNRDLAVAALHVTKSPRALAYLSRYVTQEQSDKTRALITNVVNEQQTSRGATSVL